MLRDRECVSVPLFLHSLMKSRLILFLILFTLILGVFEVFVRANGKYFFALSDRVLLRTAILERSPDTRVLFIGTSRFLDGIDQAQFSKTLEKQTGQSFKCLNGATAGIQGARFAYFAKIAAENEFLTHVILEVSPPSLHKSVLDIPTLDTVERASSKPGEKFATRMENQLQGWVGNHVGIVKYRKALRPKTLSKLVALYCSDYIDPTVWSRKGALRSIFSPVSHEVTKEDASGFQAEITRPDSIKTIAKDFEKNQYYEGLENISEIFADSGITVIWVAPPVSPASRSANHGEQFTSQYRAIAHLYGSTFYDYAGVDLDPEFQRDPTHLNAKGRKVFSTVLARQLADYFAKKPAL